MLPLACVLTYVRLYCTILFIYVGPIFRILGCNYVDLLFRILGCNHCYTVHMHPKFYGKYNTLNARLYLNCLYVHIPTKMQCIISYTCDFSYHKIFAVLNFCKIYLQIILLIHCNHAFKLFFTTTISHLTVSTNSITYVKIVCPL